MTSKVALITGASQGIGLEMVRRFKAQGFGVAACSSTERIHDAREADFTAVCDVTDAAAVRTFVQASLEKLGRIDALVNNAGLAGSNSMDADAPDDFWHRVIAVNLHGTYYFSKQVAPHLPDGEGRIINISSVLGFRGVPDQTAYCAAKHAVLGFTRALAHHLAPRRITVNAICPGWTRTKMATDRMAEIGLTEENAAAGVPIGRIIEPAEVADLALYLASPAAAGITGQDITIDGGTHA